MPKTFHTHSESTRGLRQRVRRVGYSIASLVIGLSFLTSLATAAFQIATAGPAAALGVTWLQNGGTLTCGSFNDAAVPVGTTSITATLIGGGGGGGGVGGNSASGTDLGGAGGVGASVTITNIAVPSGDTFVYVDIGCGGGGGNVSSGVPALAGGAGGGGYTAGGTGGGGGRGNNGAGGGGGGGSTVLCLGTSGSSCGSIEAMAAGGGGGGGGTGADGNGDGGGGGGGGGGAFNNAGAKGGGSGGGTTNNAGSNGSETSSGGESSGTGYGGSGGGAGVGASPEAGAGGGGGGGDGTACTSDGTCPGGGGNNNGHSGVAGRNSSGGGGAAGGINQNGQGGSSGDCSNTPALPATVTTGGSGQAGASGGYGSGCGSGDDEVSGGGGGGAGWSGGGGGDYSYTSGNVESAAGGGAGSSWGNGTTSNVTFTSGTTTPLSGTKITTASTGTSTGNPGYGCGTTGSAVDNCDGYQAAAGNITAFTFNGSAPGTPAISSGSTSFTVGEAGSVTYAATGAVSYSIATVSGSLPAGVTQSGTTGFTGTPTATGTYSFTVTATNAYGSTPTATQTLTAVEPHLVFTTQPGGGAAGATWSSQPAVAIKDVAGNTMTSTAGSISLSITSGTGTTGATLACTTNPLGTTSGVASFAGCNINYVGSGYTLTATASPYTAATSSSFNVTANQLVITQSPGNTQAGTAFSSQPIVKAEDGAGHIDSTFTGAVTLAISSGTGTSGATLSCTTNPLSASGGVANFAGCNINYVGTGYTLTASTSGLSSSAPSTSFNITASRLVVTTSPGNTMAGTPFSSQPVVEAEDASGHVDTTYTGSVTLAITSGTGTAGATFACTTNPVNAVAGVANFAGCNINFVGTGYTLTATATGLTSGASSSFNITATQLVMTQSPGNTVAGTAFSSQPIVKAEDSAGHVDSTFTGAITLSITNGTGTAGATLACTTNPVNAVAGVANFAGCNINYVGTSYTLTATAGGVATSAASSSFNITASELVFSTSPGNTTAGVPFSSQPVVKAEDSSGHVDSTFTGSVTLTITTGTGTSGAVLGCTTNPMNASSGVATFAGCNINLSGAGYTLTAAATGLTSAISSSFNITPAAASKLVFSTEPVGNVPEGTNFNTQPVVYVEDSFGNLVTGDTGTVTIAINSGPAAGVLSCTNTTVNAVGGVATFANCQITGTKAAGTYTLQASRSGLTPGTSSNVVINVGSASQLAFTIQPVGNVTEGTNFTTSPAVSVEDAFGNVVTTDNGAVTLAVNSFSGIGSQGAISCSNTGFPTINAVSGVATFTNCQITGTAAAGTYTLKATRSGLATATSANVVINIGAVTQLVFNQEPNGGADAAVWTNQPVVWIEDAFGNRETSDTSAVTLGISSWTAGFGGSQKGTLLSCTETTTAGIASFSGCNIDAVGVAAAGTYQLDATDATDSLTSATSWQTTAFNIVPAPAYTLDFVAQPSNVFAGNTMTPAVTAQVVDQFGNLVSVSGMTVTLNLSSGTITQGASASTNSAGLATFSSLVIGTGGLNLTLIASAGGLNNSAPSSSFNVSVLASNGGTLTDLATDAGSGVKSVSFFYESCGTSGWTSCGTGTLIGTSPTGPNYSFTWSSQPTDGNYLLYATAQDNVLNVSGPSSTLPVTIDNHGTIVSVTFPSNNGAYNTVGWTNGGSSPCGATGTICGQAFDSTTGIPDANHIALTITQSSTGDTWNGSTFVAGTNTVHPTTFNQGSKLWTYTFPSNDFGGVNGSYMVSVVATNGAGATSPPSVVNFVYDTVPPVVSVTFPVNSADYSASGWTNGGSSPCGATGTICGQATDATSGVPGASSISLTITEASNGNTWTGTNFASGTTAVNPTSYNATSGLWTYTFPNSDFPADGHYSVALTATDAAGNTSSSSSSSFIYEASPPTASISNSGEYSSSGTLYDGETTWPGALSGTASDANTSVTAVVVSFEQQSTGLYWTGSSFSTSTQTFLSATGTTSWSFAFGVSSFPAGGAYVVTVEATNTVGNVGMASVTFDVDYNPNQTIFVSTGGNDNNNGLTPSAPVLTLNHAITLTSTSRPVIAAASGSYNQTVDVNGGTASAIIRGGYSGSTWLRAAPGGNTVTITGQNNGASANTNDRVGVYVTSSFSPNLEQLAINSGAPSTSASATPGSAYGVLVNGGGTTNVVNSTIVASTGEPGLGATAGGNGSTGCTGGNGQSNDGAETPSCGGSGVAASGYGGADDTTGNGGQAGHSGGGGAAGGAGGSDGTFSGGNSSPGNGGGAGSGGSAGAAGQSTPGSVGGNWVGNAGGTGGTGATGGGGGGSGGAGGCTFCGDSGASGGAGGGGGTGGVGGGGGTFGGGSFAVYAYNTTVTVTGSSLTVNLGGVGGNGAGGGKGGNGGNGGTGAQDPNAGDSSGAGGGAGGSGGAGGGGGAGGPSVLVIHLGTGSVTFTLTANTETLPRSVGTTNGASGGSAGALGTGGALGSGGGPGANSTGSTGGNGGAGNAGVAGSAGQGGLMCNLYNGSSCT